MTDGYRGVLRGSVIACLADRLGNSIPQNRIALFAYLVFFKECTMRFTYKGLSAELERHIVTGAEVESYLQRLLQQSPRIAVINDRPTQLGDEVVLDYAGYCNGEQFAGGTAEKQTLVLGSGTFIPGFEEQLVDKVPGEQVTVQVFFPDVYHAPELAGKPAEFRCVIHEIRVKTPYELDDTFAKEVGGCETLEELRKQITESMQSYSDNRGESDLRDRLLAQAAATLEVSFSEEEVQAAMDQQMKALQAQLSQQGLSLDMYCAFMNTTEEKLREESRPSAEATLRQNAAADKIVELEGLQVEQEEIAEMMDMICRANGITMEQLQEYYDAAMEQAIIKSILTGKAVQLIRDTANVTVVDK